jgi:hypothetical protein
LAIRAVLRGVGQSWDATIVGQALRDLQPVEPVLVVGMLDHPAVEWYANRTVRFLGKNPVGRVPNSKADVLAVIHGTQQFVAAGPFADSSTERFRQEAEQTLADLGSYALETRVDQVLDYYRKK